MNSSIISSTVSMKALQRRIDIIANNMANLNTTDINGKATFSAHLTSVQHTARRLFVGRQKDAARIGSEDWGTEADRDAV